MSHPPHLVLIMADQLRYDALGRGFTPTLDALLAQSVSFPRAYCASALCVPARGALLTGTYPAENGCLINAGSLDAYVRRPMTSLFELLERDWDSRHVGKQHFNTYPCMSECRPDGLTRFTHTEAAHRAFLKACGAPVPGGPAFRGRCPELAQNGCSVTHSYSIPTTGRYAGGLEHYFDGYFAQGAVEAIRDRDPSKPLALCAMFLAPHPPLDIPEPYFGLVRDEQVELPANVGVWSPGQSPLQLYHLPGFWGGKYTLAQWREIWRVYLGLCGLLDDCVRRILDALREQGLYDDALIVFTSDHGEMLGAHQLWQKMCLYEEAARTPLCFKFPRSFGIAPRAVETCVSAVDVLPTLCEALDLRPGHALSGRSLMGAIRGGELAQRPVFSQYDGNKSRANPQRCVIDGRDKLIVSMFREERFLELYDLKDDPLEMNSRILDKGQRGRAERLLALLREHMARTGDPYALEEDLLERFIALRAGAAPAMP